MIIKDLSIYNFRNYEKIYLEFNDNINIFVGLNGAGKTNILESIYVLALTKSHRSYNDKNLILKDKSSLKIIGDIITKEKNKKMEIVINSRGKRVSINNLAVKKVSEYISNFDVILFCPDDLELIKGSPSERRKFLNIEIGQLNSKYFIYLNEYNNLVKNRNEYLKSITFEKYNEKYLDILNSQIIEKALYIYKYRIDFINKLQKNLEKIYNNITKKNIKIEYRNSCDIKEYNEETIKNKLKLKLNSNLRKEIFQGNTLYGPHKDDFEIYIDGINLKEYGSQGQQRLVVLCIKIAELEIFKNEIGEYPVLLLDDVFSELDIEKKNKIISYLKKDIQTFITSTDLEKINKKLLINSKIFNIKNGDVK